MCTWCKQQKRNKQTRKRYWVIAKRNNKYRKQLKKRATAAELRFKSFLDDNKINYCFQKGFFTPFHRIIDFFIGWPYNLIIELDGSSHDNKKEQDKYKDYIFYAKRRLYTLRFTNKDVFNGSAQRKFTDFINKLNT